MTGFIAFLATFVAFRSKSRSKLLRALYVAVSGMMGVFMALDFFLFYVFWELMLLPMYFLIASGAPRKEYAAIKFFIYTLLARCSSCS